MTSPNLILLRAHGDREAVDENPMATVMSGEATNSQEADRSDCHACLMRLTDEDAAGRKIAHIHCSGAKPAARLGAQLQSMTGTSALHIDHRLYLPQPRGLDNREIDITLTGWLNTMEGDGSDSVFASCLRAATFSMCRLLEEHSGGRMVVICDSDAQLRLFEVLVDPVGASATVPAAPSTITEFSRDCYTGRAPRWRLRTREDTSQVHRSCPPGHAETSDTATLLAQ